MLFSILVCVNFNNFVILQYAHRACVQRWCNEKGDITCEICHEVNPNSGHCPINIFAFDILLLLIMHVCASIGIDYTT